MNGENTRAPAEQCSSAAFSGPSVARGRSARKVGSHRIRGLRPALKATGTVGLLLLGLVTLVVAGPARAASGQVRSAAWATPRLTHLADLARAQTTKRIPYESSGGHGGAPAALDSPVDCSGLVRELYAAAFGTDIGSGSGDSMVRTSGEFSRTTHPVAGDVVLLGQGGVGPAYHAMIYVGTEGGEPVAVGSPEPGEYVKFQYPARAYWSGDLMGYWHYNGASAADSGPAIPPQATGTIDSIRTTPGRLRVTGWAFDRADPDLSNVVDIEVDGRVRWRGTAGGRRPDVDAALRIGGNHGFDVTVTAAAGSHTVSITSEGARSATGIGARRVEVYRPTVGVIDRVVIEHGGNVLISGWGADPNRPSASGTSVGLVIDGRAAWRGTTSGVRADVNRSLNIHGQHGFSVRLHLGPGRHTVSLTVFGAAISTGLTPRPFVDLTPVNGLVDDVRSAAPGKILVRGWSYDPTRPTASNRVQVYLDGRLIGLVANANRPDVNRVQRISGHHGFSVLIAAARGRHTVVVLAKGTNSYAADQVLTNRVLTVG